MKTIHYTFFLGKLVVNNENYSFMEEKDDSVDKFKIVPSKNLRKNVLYIKEEKNEYFLKMEDVINFDEKKIEEYSYNENSLWNVIRYTSNKMVLKILKIKKLEKYYLVKSNLT